MKNILGFILCLVLGLSACISPDPALKEYLQNGATLVDVRTAKEFAEGSVKGAINIPLGQIKNRKEELLDKKAVVVFCRSGMRSSKALSILKEQGFENVINGGSWQAVKKVQEEGDN